MTDRPTAKKSPTRGVTSPKVLPIISIGSDIREVVSFAEEVLVQSGEIFRHHGGLAHVVSSEHGPQILPAASERLREVLASGADWRLKDEAVLPPSWILEALLARGSSQSIPQLEAAVEYPVLRPDGSLLSAPGYNALARVFYQPNAEFPPLPPLDQEAAFDAAARLCGVVDDLPFEAAIDRAAFIGALLTIFARHAFEGPAPILLLEGRPGVGKTLLAQAAIAIATGHPSPLPSPPSAYGPVALYDNFEGKISTAWADSLLGSGQLVIVAGENLEIEPGAARRCIRCRLHSPLFGLTGAADSSTSISSIGCSTNGRPWFRPRSL